MRARKWIRRTLTFSGITLILLLAILFSAPIWLPWVLPSILSKFNVQYSVYERQGYTRAVVRDVVYEEGNVRFTASSVGTFTPVTWAWKRIFTGTKKPFVVVKDWTLDIARKRPPTPIHKRIQNAKPPIVTLEFLAPKGELQNGHVLWRGHVFFIHSAHWTSNTLQAEIVSRGLFPPVNLEARFSPVLPTQLAIHSKPLSLFGTFIVAQTPQTTLVNGRIESASGKPARVYAEFGANDVLPQTARVEAESFQLPSRILGLPWYEDLTGSVSAIWDGATFNLDIKTKAAPQKAHTNLPPITASAKAHGGTNLVRVDILDISTPYLQARLSEPIELTYTGEMLTREAKLNLLANLANQRWWPMRGIVRSELILRAHQSAVIPNVSFRLLGEKLKIDSVKVEHLNAAGRLDFPSLMLDSFEAEFENGGRIAASGFLDLRRRWIERATLSIDGRFAPDMLPAGYAYEKVTGKLQIHGPIHSPKHSGTLQIKGASIKPVVPLDITSSWTGEFRDIDSFRAAVIPSKQEVLANEPTPKLDVAGSALLNPSGFRMELKKFELTGTNSHLTLSNRTSVTFERTKEQTWTAQLDHLLLLGDRSVVDVDSKIKWPSQGQASVSLRELSFDLFQPFLVRKLPPISIREAELNAKWEQSPASFSFHLLTDSHRVSVKLGETQLPPFSAEFHVVGDSTGIAVQRFTILSESAPIASGSGFVPIRFWPDRARHKVEVLETNSFRLALSTLPNKQFWSSWTAGTPVTLDRPVLNVSIAGTPRSPEGVCEIKVAGANIQAWTNRPALRLRSIDAHLNFSREKLKIEKLRFLAEGQPINATGSIPVPETWTKWREAFDARNLTGRIEGSAIRIAPFARFAPKTLSPQGRVNFHLQAINGQLSGQLDATNAATRPIGQLGPFLDIDMHLRLAGDTVDILPSSALLGGGPVAVSGQVNWRKREPKSGIPEFALKLRGDSVPLIRRSDLILRSRFDLDVSNTNKGNASITGKVTLQNSYYLSDLRLLVPAKTASPQNRPPFFSVQVEPFADWKLDVLIHGSRFLRVQSPFFVGIGSADFRLRGTLREPVALGTARVNSGTLQFPFASMQITQGEVTLPPENPYQARLFVTAATQAYGYDIRVEITGNANDPVLTFTSTPGLPPEQILLMLTSGEMPTSARARSFSSQQRAQRLGFFVGKNFLSRLGLFQNQERLTLRSGESLVDPGVQSYSAAYRLTNNLWIVGDYDRYGGVNAGIRWRFYSK